MILTQDEQKFKAVIKCQCGAKLILPSRSGTSTFVLSNFYAHLTTSKCSMVKRIRKQENKTSDNEVDSQLSSNSDSQLPTLSSNNNNTWAVTNSSKRTLDDNIQSEINKNSRKKRKC